MTKHIAEIYVDKIIQANTSIEFHDDNYLRCGTSGKNVLFCKDCPYSNYLACSVERANHANTMNRYINQNYPEILL